MQKNIKSMLRSIQSFRSGSTLMQPKPMNSASTITALLYDSISSLTLDRFIKICVDGDVNLLKVNPTDHVPAITLLILWKDIHESFMDGMQDKEGLYKSRLLGKINHLQFNYEFIQLCVKFLSIGYDREVVNELSRVVRVGEFNPEDMKGYFRDLQVVLNRAQGIQLQIQEKQAEYAILSKDQTPGGKVTRKQFDQLIASVSIYAKFHIDKRLVSVSEFIEYYSSQAENNRAMEEAHNNSKR